MVGKVRIYDVRMLEQPRAKVFQVNLTVGQGKVRVYKVNLVGQQVRIAGLPTGKTEPMAQVVLTAATTDGSVPTKYTWTTSAGALTQSTSSVLATEGWTGTDGSAWPAAWTVLSNTAAGTPGAATISGNMGAMLSPTGGAYSEIIAQRQIGMGTSSDTRVDFTTYALGDEGNDDWYLSLNINTDGTFHDPVAGPDPGRGIILWFGWANWDRKPYLQFGAARGSGDIVYTYFELAPDFYVPGTTYTLRLLRDGIDWKAWVWPTGTAMPTAPMATHTDDGVDPYADGGVGVSASGGGTTDAPYMTFWDNLVVSGPLNDTATILTPSALAGVVANVSVTATIGGVTTPATTGSFEVYPQGVWQLSPAGVWVGVGPVQALPASGIW